MQLNFKKIINKNFNLSKDKNFKIQKKYVIYNYLLL